MVVKLVPDKVLSDFNQEGVTDKLIKTTVISSGTKIATIIAVE